jgi:hypothetical protein
MEALSLWTRRVVIRVKLEDNHRLESTLAEYRKTASAVVKACGAAITATLTVTGN